MGQCYTCNNLLSFGYVPLFLMKIVISKFLNHLNPLSGEWSYEVYDIGNDNDWKRISGDVERIL